LSTPVVEKHIDPNQGFRQWLSNQFKTKQTAKCVHCRTVKLKKDMVKLQLYGRFCNEDEAYEYWLNQQ
jgi:hypothetical protein